MFRWVGEHEPYYVGQNRAARVLVLGGPWSSGRAYRVESFRGIFRVLSEEHIPFAVSDNMDWVGRREYDLVIATDWTSALLRRYVENGGALLVASAEKPEVDVARGGRSGKELKG